MTSHSIGSLHFLAAARRGKISSGEAIALLGHNGAGKTTLLQRVYVLRSGRIILEEPADALAATPREKWWGLF